MVAFDLPILKVTGCFDCIRSRASERGCGGAREVWGKWQNSISKGGGEGIGSEREDLIKEAAAA